MILNYTTVDYWMTMGCTRDDYPLSLYQILISGTIWQRRKTHAGRASFNGTNDEVG